MLNFSEVETGRKLNGEVSVKWKPIGNQVLRFHEIETNRKLSDEVSVKRKPIGN